MIIDYAWRLAHAEAGDRALGNAMALLDMGFSKGPERMPDDATIMPLTSVAQAYAAIAQAHYAAANIRTKPQES